MCPFCGLASSYTPNFFTLWNLCHITVSIQVFLCTPKTSLYKNTSRGFYLVSLQLQERERERESFSSMEMMKMVSLLYLLFLHFVSLTGAFQEHFELINLYDSTPTITNVPVAVSVSHEDLNQVSSSILMAETWVRTHVLAHYPATKITTIVVGQTVLCNTNQADDLGMVLPSVKNIYHSLTRWGLEKEIKVSAAFSSDCLDPNSGKYRDDLSENVIKPLLSFIERTNSTYSVNPPPNFSPLSSSSVSLVSSHSTSMKKLGFLGVKNVNFILKFTKEKKPMSRKLSFMVDSKFVEPYPARPTPLPEISPIHSSIGYSVPATIAKSPLSPHSSNALPPSLTFPFAPEQSPPQSPSFPSPSFPFINPANPPFGSTLPPCNPSYTGGGGGYIAPSPAKTGEEQGMWCVAKPSVPAETLQEAMDYACGAGGADCDEIGPHGSCYHPDTVVAHASFAFNNYWQKNKKIGGSCNFGGTAMIISSDPSFLHCRFVLS